MSRARKGFTLIELLIVVVIIGILAAIAIPKLSTAKERAFRTAVLSDLRNLVTAEEAYFADSSKYTPTLSQLKYQISPNVAAPAIAVGPGSWTATTTHAQLLGVVCGVSVNAPNPVVSGANEGQPVCK